MEVHRRVGGCQRGDGRREARVFSGDSGNGGLAGDSAGKHHQLIRGDGRRQRPDSPRDRHELRDRCDGPYNHANATIGRAYGLLSQNLQGGSVPEFTYLGSQGNNYAYTNITFAENEERSPWQPFQVQHGFDTEESVVSVFSGCHATTYPLGLREKHWREHVKILLNGINPTLDPVLILDPITARQFIDRGGFDTKEKPIRWVHENGTLPAGVYWDYQLIQNEVLPRALNGDWETSGAPFCAGSAPSSRRARYAHLVLSFSLRSTSSPSVASSKPGSIFGRSRSSSVSLASRLS